MAFALVVKTNCNVLLIQNNNLFVTIIPTDQCHWCVCVGDYINSLLDQYVHQVS